MGVKFFFDVQIHQVAHLRFVHCSVCIFYFHEHFKRGIKSDPKSHHLSWGLLPSLPQTAAFFSQASRPHYPDATPSSRGSTHLWATSHRPSPEDDLNKCVLGPSHALSTLGTGVLCCCEEDGRGRTRGFQPHLCGSLAMCPQQSHPALVSSYTMGGLTQRKSQPLFRV